MAKFSTDVAITGITGVLKLSFGMLTSVILARVLGPESRGVYALALLLPSLIVAFGNLGIGPATVYYVARRDFRWTEILGNNILLAIGLSGFGIVVGLVITFLFRETIFPGVSLNYLLLALVLVPIQFLYSYIRYILLGAQRIKEFNYVQIMQSVLFLGLVLITLLGFKAGVTGAILAGIIAWLIADILIFVSAKRIAGGIVIKLNTSYIKRATTYGVQAHISNVLGFLNYRVDIFLVNAFVGPAGVGLYAVGVGLAEKLWMVSHAASTVLFPRVAEANEEGKRKKFTPLVARTVLWMTSIGALVFGFFSLWVVVFLYSGAFLPAARVLQALLVGIVTLSVGRVLANDISGRGFPGFNIYIGIASVVTNVVLNLLWIPRYGIVGAAWASTISYTVSFLGALFFYCRLSGNHWTKVLLPQRGDWAIYRNVSKSLWSRLAAMRQNKGEII